MSHKGTLKVVIAATLSIVAASADAAGRRPAAPTFPFGTWENEKHTVRVRIDRCGALACGRVVWATAEAKADAQRGGTENLIGVQLFRDLAPSEDGAWTGKIFVPDLNGTFDGTVRANGPAGLTAEGCVAKLVCKSQGWTRRGR